MSVVGGETLIQRKIRQLKSCCLINRVVVGSNCDEMLDHAEKCGAEAIRRPDYFCDESKASANEMIGNMCSLIETDVIVWTHCTNPLISTSIYEKSILTFMENGDQYDSLISVVEMKEHLWGENKEPLNFNPLSRRHTPARELPPYYMQDGGYLYKTNGICRIILIFLEGSRFCLKFQKMNFLILTMKSI